MKLMRLTGLAAAALCLALSAAVAAEDGKALLESKCTTCHSAKMTMAVKRDKAGWTKTIEKMKAKGAKLTDAEAEAIADYLVEAAGK